MPVLIGIIVCVFLIILRELEKSDTRRILDKAKDMSFINKGLEYYQRKQQLNREFNMTREEAIKKLESLKILLPAAKDEISGIIKLIETPWISVKDDLPCNHEELIRRNAKNAWTVCCIVSNGMCTMTDRMSLIEGKWDWGMANVTHWFAIPELPKE